MRLPDFPPLSIIKNRLVPGQWDVLAFLLVITFFIYLAEAAHGLTQPLARLEATPISLDPRIITASRRAKAVTVTPSASAQKTRVVACSMRSHRAVALLKLTAAIGTISAITPI